MVDESERLKRRKRRLGDGRRSLREGGKKTRRGREGELELEKTRSKGPNPQL